MSKKIRCLKKCLHIIRTELTAQDLPIQQILLFLEVASREGISLKELGKIMDMPSGSVSRNIKILSQYFERGEMRGFDVIEAKPNPYDRKSYALHLTERGQNLLDKLSGVFKVNNSSEESA